MSTTATDITCTDQVPTVVGMVTNPCGPADYAAAPVVDGYKQLWTQAESSNCFHDVKIGNQTVSQAIYQGISPGNGDKLNMTGVYASGVHPNGAVTFLVEDSGSGQLYNLGVDPGDIVNVETPHDLSATPALQVIQSTTQGGVYNLNGDLKFSATVGRTNAFNMESSAKLVVADGSTLTGNSMSAPLNSNTDAAVCLNGASMNGNAAGNFGDYTVTGEGTYTDSQETDIVNMQVGDSVNYVARNNATAPTNQALTKDIAHYNNTQEVVDQAVAEQRELFGQNQNIDAGLRVNVSVQNPPPPPPPMHDTDDFDSEGLPTKERSWYDWWPVVAAGITYLGGTLAVPAFLQKVCITEENKDSLTGQFFEWLKTVFNEDYAYVGEIAAIIATLQSEDELVFPIAGGVVVGMEAARALFLAKYNAWLEGEGKDADYIKAVSRTAPGTLVAVMIGMAYQHFATQDSNFELALTTLIMSLGRTATSQAIDGITYGVQKCRSRDGGEEAPLLDDAGNPRGSVQDIESGQASAGSSSWILSGMSRAVRTAVPAAMAAGVVYLGLWAKDAYYGNEGEDPYSLGVYEETSPAETVIENAFTSVVSMVGEVALTAGSAAVVAAGANLFSWFRNNGVNCCTRDVAVEHVNFEVSGPRPAASTSQIR